MKFSIPVRRTILSFAGAIAISSAFIAPAFAADSVTQQITGGGALSAVVSDATMASVTYSNTAGSTIGALTLTVNDPRGTSLGWNVTIASSDFVYGGSSTLGIDIPKVGFVIGTPAEPVLTVGQAVDFDVDLQVNLLGGPNPGVGGSLNTPRETISAEDGFGSGIYTQNLPVTLVIPAYSQTGTYVATLTVLITSAP